MKHAYRVDQHDLTSGRVKTYAVIASTPRGASMKVSRDHYLYLSINKVYFNNKLVYSTK